ncbi:uncharacterized protein LOC130613086 isoform X2 [Hydractinia symbiolongicarpus]|nr:uncharacterized protein LOC130613086 isoform X2 [Hydractinia symbiolongicarpus]
MSIRKVLHNVVRLSSTRASFRTSTANADIIQQQNSSEYSLDGEKIECRLKFNKTGDRTEEELAMIVESARAKSFDDSLKNVASVKFEAT